jgi:hypothetical protein
MKKNISMLLLIICMVLQIQSIAQVKKPKATPATPQMPDIEKMLKELPADQQAMAKEMLGNATGKTTAIKKEVTPAPSSPIIQIKLAQPVKAPTQAQAKDRLLWYKGKKINDSMLITTQAMLVLYSPKRNMVIAQPLEEKDPFRSMVKNVSKEQKMTEDYVEAEAAKPNSWMNYPTIQRTVDHLALIDEQFNNAIKNTIDLPEVPFSSKATGQDKNVPPAKQEKIKPKIADSKNCADVNNNIKSGLIKQHESLKSLLNNPPDINVDAPPKESFGTAFRCDKSVQEKYTQDVKNWHENVIAYERLLLQSAMAPERTIQISGLDDNCADEISPGLSADIDKSMKLSLSRSDQKIKKLINTYGKDIFRQVPVIQLALGLERQKQLMGIDDPDEGIISKIAELFAGPEFENYMNEQIEKKNWDVILDLSAIMGRARQCQLMGAEGDAADRIDKLLNRAKQMNRFAITVDIDFNERYHDAEGEDVLKINGSIKTTEKVYVSLFPRGCDWILQQPPFDAKKGVPYIPMQVVSGLKSVKEDKNWTNYSYSGPKDMRMYFPIFSIDFTRTNAPDTAVLQILRYVNDLPAMPVAEAYTTDLTGYLNDVYMKPEETGANEQKVQDFGKDIMSKFSAITSTQNNTTTLEKLKFQNSMMMQRQEATKGMSEIFNTAKTVILFNAQNGSSTLIDGKVDTKHKNDNVEVIYGIFKLKVVHDPYP